MSTTAVVRSTAGSADRIVNAYRLGFLDIAGDSDDEVPVMNAWWQDCAAAHAPYILAKHYPDDVTITADVATTGQRFDHVPVRVELARLLRAVGGEGSKWSCGDETATLLRVRREFAATAAAELRALMEEYVVRASSPQAA